MTDPKITIPVGARRHTLRMSVLLLAATVACAFALFAVHLLLIGPPVWPVWGIVGLLGLAVGLLRRQGRE